MLLACLMCRGPKQTMAKQLQQCGSEYVISYVLSSWLATRYTTVWLLTASSTEPSVNLTQQQPSSGTTACDDPFSNASSSAGNMHLDFEIKPWGPPDFIDDVRKLLQDRAELQQLGEVRLLTTVLVSVSLLRQCDPAGTDVVLLYLLDVDHASFCIAKWLILLMGFAACPRCSKLWHPCGATWGQRVQARANPGTVSVAQQQSRPAACSPVQHIMTGFACCSCVTHFTCTMGYHA
jgi:hypothetical protein